MTKLGWAAGACFVASPFVIVGILAKTHRAAESQLAAAHVAGYRLALNHVARGLLDRSTPTGSGEEPAGNPIQHRPPRRRSEQETQ